jgi:biofilm PGA synthesis N-glycosyltransferase PgaC
LISRRELLLVLAIGLLVRELFAPWTGHPWDLEVFVRVGYYVAHGVNPYALLDPVPGLTFTPYGEMTSVGYPPLWPLLCGFLYSVYSVVHQFITSAGVYYGLLKQPAIFADLLCALVSYRLVGGKGSTAVLLFWLFNPLFIILSGMWGMFDSLAVLLVLLSLALMAKGRSSGVGLALGLGSVLKLVPVIYAPVAFLFSRSKLRFAALFAASVAAAILLPFLLLGWSPTGFLFSMASQAVNIRDAPAVGGLTVFGAFEVINMVFPDRVPELLLTALSFLWIPALGVFYLRLCWPWLRGMAGRAKTSWQFSLEEALRLLIIATLIFLLTRPWVSEGTVLYLVSLMLIDVALFHGGRRGLFTALWVLALLFLVVNNTLLIRFATPLWGGALQLDLAINNGAVTGPIRLAAKLLLSFGFYSAALVALRVYWRGTGGQPAVWQVAPAKDVDLTTKKVTVGICAHNEEGNIGELLDSIKAEELGGDARLVEVIVVSSGSTDGTNAIVRGRAESFGKVSLIAEPERTGKSSAQNVILRQARGNVIVMISADSVIKPGALGRLVGAVGGDVGAAKARAVPLNEEGGIANFASRFIWELLHQTNLYLGFRGMVNSLGGDMVAMRAGIVGSIPADVVNDDAYLGAVVRGSGFQIAYVPDSVLYIRGPSTVGDFLRQRSRVLYGHRQLSGRYGIRPNVFENIMLGDPVSAAGIFVKACSRFSLGLRLQVPLVMVLELAAQLESRVGKRDYVLWDMVSTSKRRITGGEEAARP